MIVRLFTYACVLVFVAAPSIPAVGQQLFWDTGSSRRNSDANDGPSWPGPGKSSKPNNDVKVIGEFFDAIIKGAQANEKKQQSTQPWQQPTQPWQQSPQPWQQGGRPQQPKYIQPQPQYTQPQPQYTQPNTRYVEPRPVYIQPPVEKKVAVKANPKPLEKTADTKRNSKPLLGGFSLASKTELDRLEKVVDKEAKEDFEQLVNGLGDALIKEPGVAEILEEGKQAVIDGKEIPADWKDRLKDAVDNAIMNDPKLAPAVTPAGFDNLVRDFESTTGALAAIRESIELANNGITNGGTPGPANGPFLPSGMTQVVFVPVLGTDDVLVAPGGGVIIMGTGGEGSLDTVSVDASEALGIPLGIGEPEPDTASKVSDRIKEGVVLSNPKENGVDINYVLSNRNFTMKPGYSQTLPGGKVWEVRFSRGDGMAEAKYNLKDGTYHFGSGNDGWELYRQSFGVTIDNKNNDQPFNYVVDNTEVTISPGQTKQHSSSFPILLRFDRGDGGKEAIKKIAKDGYYLKLGVSPSDGLWDLFPEETGLSLANAEERASATLKMAGKDPSRLSRLQALLKASKK